ncbi:hypothetical protein [Nocardiopsis synnemataformans]|uniref:hypothetical protein n=1 Tax=Nocardiopsis synnemataformans TaxID=61305 RepID=UPI003EBCF6BB
MTSPSLPTPSQFLQDALTAHGLQAWEHTDPAGRPSILVRPSNGPARGTVIVTSSGNVDPTAPVTEWDGWAAEYVAEAGGTPVPLDPPRTNDDRDPWRRLLVDSVELARDLHAALDSPNWSHPPMLSTPAEALACTLNARTGMTSHPEDACFAHYVAIGEVEVLVKGCPEQGAVVVDIDTSAAAAGMARPRSRVPVLIRRDGRTVQN